MKIRQGKVTEILLDGSMRIECPPDVIPLPGQYLHAYKPASNSPLPVSLFFTDSSFNGFRAAPPTPLGWRPGDAIHFRGPLGNGFQISPFVKHIAFIAFDGFIGRLNGLMIQALKENKEAVLICDAAPQGLPEALEAQPLQALPDVLRWAEYAAFDVRRENVNQLKAMLREQNQASPKIEAQVLIHADMPCGGIAECGVCALMLPREWKMICKEGPVFNAHSVLWDEG